MNNNRWLILPLLLLFAALLTACGSAPTIRNSQRLVDDGQQASSVQFVYRISELRKVSSTSRGSLPRHDHGYANFGGYLTQQAGQVFGKYGVKVVESREIEAHDKLSLFDSAQDPAPLLILYAVSGKVSANRHNSRESYVFEAQLRDASQGRLLWRATIDTSTWSGDDFVLNGMKKTLYDEAYAEQLLNALAQRMKSDQMI